MRAMDSMLILVTHLVYLRTSHMVSYQMKNPELRVSVGNHSIKMLMGSFS